MRKIKVRGHSVQKLDWKRRTEAIALVLRLVLTRSVCVYVCVVGWSCCEAAQKRAGAVTEYQSSQRRQRGQQLSWQLAEMTRRQPDRQTIWVDVRSSDCKHIRCLLESVTYETMTVQAYGTVWQYHSSAPYDSNLLSCIMNDGFISSSIDKNFILSACVVFGLDLRLTSVGLTT